MVKRYTLWDDFGTIDPEQDDVDADGVWVTYDDYAALEARVAELERDAARYLWLRDVGYGKATRILTNMTCVADCLIDESISREA